MKVSNHLKQVMSLMTQIVKKLPRIIRIAIILFIPAVLATARHIHKKDQNQLIANGVHGGLQDAIEGAEEGKDSK